MANSYVSYTADGATQTFTVTFPYINTDHVEAYVDGVEDESFTWATSSTITLSALPDNGAVIRIVRVTPKATRLVDFEAGNTMSEDNLDTDSQQNFFAMQETLEDLEDLIELDPDDDEFDAESKNIKNVLDPTEAQHAATKNYIDVTFVSDLATAVAAAEAAQAAAETAETNAETAETNAETAETGAEAAEDGCDADLVLTNADVVLTNADVATIAATIATHMATQNEYSKKQSFDETAITSTANAVAWDLDSNQVTVHTLTENTTFSAPTNHDAGAQYRLTIIQEATERTVSWNAAYEWEGDAPIIPSTDGDMIIIVFDDDGTVLRGKTFYTEA